MDTLFPMAQSGALGDPAKEPKKTGLPGLVAKWLEEAAAIYRQDDRDTNLIAQSREECADDLAAALAATAKEWREEAAKLRADAVAAENAGFRTSAAMLNARADLLLECADVIDPQAGGEGE